MSGRLVVRVREPAGRTATHVTSPFGWIADGTNSVCWCLPSGLRDVEAVEHHDLAPGVNEVLYKLLSCVVGCVDFGDSTQFRI